MSENINNEKLTYKQMQEMLPDYVFGRTIESDRLAFEKCLPDYPDIQQEVNEVSAVFRKMELMDIEKPIRDKSKNLSVKVNQKLYRNTQPKYSGKFNLKLIMPLMAFLIAGAMFLYYNRNDEQISNAVQSSELQILSNSDIKAITNDTNNIDIIIESADIYSKSNSVDFSDLLEYENEINELTNNAIIESVLKDKNSLKKYLSKFNYSDPTLLDDLNNLDEKDFQSIYEDIKNEDINS